MSQGIKNSQLADLIATTLPDLPKNRFEVAFDYENYEVCNRWFREDRVDVDGGTHIERNIMLDDSGNARYVRLFQTSSINVADVQKKITIPWCQLETHWSMERREVLRNRNNAKGFIKLIKSRRVDGMISLANLIEQRAWKTPQNANDDLYPFGLPYWICMANAGVTGEGFIGQTARFQDGSTTTVIAGMDAAAHDKWRNYAATYTTFNATVIKKMRKLFTAIQFKQPMLVKDLEQGPLSNYRIYMGLDEVTEFETMAEAQNDNLGPDLAKFQGVTTFRRVPVVYIPLLDDDQYDPIYFINHNKFYPVVQEDDWLVESEPMSDRLQHNVITTFVDGSHQFLCTNRRVGGGVLHKPIAA